MPLGVIIALFYFCKYIQRLIGMCIALLCFELAQHPAYIRNANFACSLFSQVAYCFHIFWTYSVCPCQIQFKFELLFEQSQWVWYEVNTCVCSSVHYLRISSNSFFLAKIVSNIRLFKTYKSADWATKINLNDELP